MTAQRDENSVVLVGAGNVGSHLAHALVGAGYRVIGVTSRTLASAKRLAERLPQCEAATDIAALARAYIYIICTPDDFIPSASSQISAYAPEALLIHTSGSTPLSVFGTHRRCGVMYPLQTFSRSRAIDFHEVPLFVEGNNEEALLATEALAKKLCRRVSRLDSAARKSLHLAAVFACNFPNACIDIASQLMDDAGQDWHLLLPLIHEMVDKLNELSPHEAQTGPAARGDRQLIARQRTIIHDAARRKVYDALSDYILARAADE